MTTQNLTENDLYEIVESTLTLKNSIVILCDYCQYNETNDKLMSVLCLLVILAGECDKILDKF